MEYLMNYGRLGLKLELPDHWNVTVIRKKEMPVLPDPNAAIGACIETATGIKNPFR